MRFEILGTELSEQDKERFSEQTLKLIYKISKIHDIANIVADALDRNGLLENGLRKTFLNERNMAVYRYEQMQYEFLRLCDTFEEEKIDFIPLKGAVLRSLYPQPWFRTSCDIDILVKEEDLDRTIAVLQKKLKCTCTSIGQHDAQLFLDNGKHLELHFSLLESGSKEELKVLLNKVWENVQSKTEHWYVMDNYFLYCYLLSHMAKHMRFGGCGIRSVLDIWLFNQRNLKDEKKRDDLLKQSGLFTFAKAIEKLSNVWMLGEKHDELSRELEEYILTGGVYGSVGNKVSTGQAKSKNKFSYLFSRVFLPYEKLKYKYPILQKHPWLFPFYQIVRWFKPIFNKKSKKRTSRELKRTLSTSEEQQKRIRKLMNDLDI